MCSRPNSVAHQQSPEADTELLVSRTKYFLNVILNQEICPALESFATQTIRHVQLSCALKSVVCIGISR